MISRKNERPYLRRVAKTSSEERRGKRRTRTKDKKTEGAWTDEEKRVHALGEDFRYYHCNSIIKFTKAIGSLTDRLQPRASDSLLQGRLLWTSPLEQSFVRSFVRPFDR